MRIEIVRGPFLESFDEFPLLHSEVRLRPAPQNPEKLAGIEKPTAAD